MRMMGSECGSALVMSLMTAGILGITLSGYYYLMGGSMKVSARSLAWNSGISVAEAGLEEH